MTEKQQLGRGRMSGKELTLIPELKDQPTDELKQPSKDKESRERDTALAAAYLYILAQISASAKDQQGEGS
jgi:hypothetical protein